MSDDAHAALAAALELQRATTEAIASLRELIREHCEHPLVTEDRAAPWAYRRRVCLSCGSAEASYAGQFHFLHNPGRVVERGVHGPPKLDNSNIHIQYFAWCKGKHLASVKHLPYGWCDEHMPDTVREQQRRDNAREAYFNSAG